MEAKIWMLERDFASRGHREGGFIGGGGSVVLVVKVRADHGQEIS